MGEWQAVTWIKRSIATPRYRSEARVTGYLAAHVRRLVADANDPATRTATASAVSSRLAAGWTCALTDARSAVGVTQGARTLAR